MWTLEKIFRFTCIIRRDEPTHACAVYARYHVV
jgi:hypothetical protein